MSDKQRLKDVVIEYKKARKKIDTAVTEVAKKADRIRQEHKE